MISPIIQRDAASLSVPGASARFAPVIACALARHHTARIVGSLRGRAEVRTSDSFAELRVELTASAGDISAVIIPSRDPSGAEALQTVREIAAQRPRTAIIIHSVVGEQHNIDLRALAMAGAHQFVFAGIDDVGVAFRTILDAANRQCAAQCVMKELAPLVPRKLHRIVEVALHRSAVANSVTALASAVGVQRTTLSHWCAREGFLVPEELLTWARLAMVAYYLESTGCTVEAVSQELAYPSDTALRNTVRRYLGVRSTELRREGGLQMVMQRLTDRLRAGERPKTGARPVTPTLRAAR